MTGNTIDRAEADRRDADLVAEGEHMVRDLLRLPHGTRRLGAGEFLCLEGDRAHSVYVVLAGRISVCRVTASGRTVVLNTVGGREVLGEIGVFTHRPRMACLRAESRSSVAVIGDRDAIDAATRHALLAVGVAGVAMERLRGLADRVLDVAGLRLEQRLAATLLGAAADAGGIVRLSQQQLADQLAVTRESVNRQLQRWSAAAVVNVCRGGLAIADHARLREIASSV